MAKVKEEGKEKIYMTLLKKLLIDLGTIIKSEWWCDDCEIHDKTIWVLWVGWV